MIKQVVEFEPITKDEIGEKAFSELETLAKSSHPILGYRRNGVLQARNYVGIIQTKSGFTLEILPKISKQEDIGRSKAIFLKMLKALPNSPYKHIDSAALKVQKFPLLEVFISMFLQEVESIVKKGIKRDYITKEENLRYLKGKLKISDHIRHNFIHKERFFVEYDEYLPDRVENRIIKTALLYLSKLSTNFKNLQKIRELLFIFDEIGSIQEIKSSFTKVKKTRDINYYQNALHWSRLFLLGQSPIPYSGDSISFAILFDMNRLFEAYVGKWIKQTRDDFGFESVVLQERRKYLFNEKIFSLQPDIIVNGGEFIFDTKWKIVRNEQEISRADLYQIFSYAARYEQCRKAFLVYPHVEDKVFRKKLTSNIGDRHVEFEVVYFNLENLDTNYDIMKHKL